MKLRLMGLLFVVSALACDSSADAYEDSFEVEDPPMGGCESGGTGPCAQGSADGTAAMGDPCDGSNQCDNGLSCAAPFADGDPGRMVCQDSCIELGDPTLWCSDDAACCTGICGPRGLCVTAPGTGSTTGTDADATGSTGSESGAPDSGESGTTAGDTGSESSGSGTTSG